VAGPALNDGVERLEGHLSRKKLLGLRGARVILATAADSKAIGVFGGRAMNRVKEYLLCLVFFGVAPLKSLASRAFPECMERKEDRQFESPPLHQQSLRTESGDR